MPAVFQEFPLKYASKYADEEPCYTRWVDAGGAGRKPRAMPHYYARHAAQSARHFIQGNRFIDTFRHACSSHRIDDIEKSDGRRHADNSMAKPNEGISPHANRQPQTNEGYVTMTYPHQCQIRSRVARQYRGGGIGEESNGQLACAWKARRVVE